MNLPFTFTPKQVSETTPEYASRVLRALLDTYTTAPFTDEDLEQADRAAQRAVSQLPAELSPTDQIVNRKLAGARTMIAGELAWRRQRTEAQRACTAAVYPQGGSQGGRPAPLLPPPPPTLPPADAYAQRPGDRIRF